MYVNPNVASEEYIRQNDRFREAILGVVFDVRSCEEQLQFLDGEEYRVIGEDGANYTSARERCAALLQGEAEPEDAEIAAAVDGAANLARLHYMQRRQPARRLLVAGGAVGDECVTDAECQDPLKCAASEESSGSGAPTWECQEPVAAVFRFTPSTSLAPHPDIDTWEPAGGRNLDPNAVFSYQSSGLEDGQGGDGGTNGASDDEGEGGEDGGDGHGGEDGEGGDGGINGASDDGGEGGEDGGGGADGEGGGGGAEGGGGEGGESGDNGGHEAEHDCEDGQQEHWDEAKSIWCCDHANKGCFKQSSGR
ncbi:unnamed protein product [Prorocentrum cordatum]|uniref:Uncharacterized protein n=1 Tax=Prorocentrum cordatum TaxID=2364126 RepID=A0ABN9WGJ7_9DINO|nr:unnamed protein product [Polarella glacialis]